MNPTLTIVCVATDRYLDYWIDLVNSLQPESQEVDWLLFTDRGSDIPESIVSRLDKKLTVIFQEHLPWPQPTLLRYRWISQHSALLKTSNIMYLDADMFFTRPLDLNALISENSEGKFVTVKHPGFYRPKRLLSFYLAHPSFFFGDMRLFIKEGGLGTWEKSKKSKAYVRRNLRRDYVCGGCWFGPREYFTKFVSELDRMVATDSENQIIARFHDESHLNALIALHPEIKIIAPSFCFDPTYPQLKEIDGIIVAVDKNARGAWRR